MSGQRGNASPLQGHDHALRRAGHFDAAPCRRPVRDGIRPAEGFINADRVEMRRLVTGHIDERQQETKALTACIDGEDQSDGHHFVQDRCLPTRLRWA